MQILLLKLKPKTHITMNLIITVDRPLRLGWEYYITWGHGACESQKGTPGPLIKDGIRDKINACTYSLVQEASWGIQ